MLLMDGILNFSRSYLPEKRGGKMDAPLVLTTRIDPKEVDKEAHNIDLLARYPLEFYRATQEIKTPPRLKALWTSSAAGWVSLISTSTLCLHTILQILLQVL